MDSIFGIGAPELIVILVLAGIVMGPQRMYQIAHWLGRVTAQLQSISRQFARQLASELEGVDPSGDLRKAHEEVLDLRKQISDLRQEFTSVAVKTTQETENSIGDIRRLAQPNVAPARPNPAAANGNVTPLPNPIDITDDPES